MVPPRVPVTCTSWSTFHVTPGETIPADDAHVHYGDGATAAQLELSPGEHTLCLQAGDGTHTALDLTDEITFTVEG